MSKLEWAPGINGPCCTASMTGADCACAAAEQDAREWWMVGAGLRGDAACARRVVASPPPPGMVWRHCDHVSFLPGFFCRKCKAGTPLRLVPRPQVLDESVRSLRDAWVRGDEVDL